MSPDCRRHEDTVPAYATRVAHVLAEQGLLAGEWYGFPSPWAAMAHDQQTRIRRVARVIAKAIGPVAEKDGALFPTPEPHELRCFAGETYEQPNDQKRLTKQYDLVFALMGDGVWRTLREISGVLNIPEASASARLRDMRKEENGSHRVERRRRGDPRTGLHEYRVTKGRIA